MAVCLNITGSELSSMKRLTKQESGNDDSSSNSGASLPIVETLKTEVIKSIADALECKAGFPTGILDFDEKRGVEFYEEVTKFEVELIEQALACTKGNQRAAARLLGLKTTTLNSKVKLYNLDLDSINTGST